MSGQGCDGCTQPEGEKRWVHNVGEDGLCARCVRVAEAEVRPHKYEAGVVPGFCAVCLLSKPDHEATDFGKIAALESQEEALMMMTGLPKELGGKRE